MSLNRLFIYDSESNTAVCIAKGYSTQWGTGIEYQDKFFSGVKEFTGSLSKTNPTRLKLYTEDDLPKGVGKVFYEP
tara:strand:+ start:1535 stop:1762 length:228 start_codon:yes stop_codon:yes gene_type:complete